MKTIVVSWKYSTGVEISENLDHFRIIIPACHHIKRDSEVVMSLQWNRRVSKEPSENRRTENPKHGVP